MRYSQISGSLMYLEFFYFEPFLIIFLKITRYNFYLHVVARLAALARTARQTASVAPVHVMRYGCHAGPRSQRCALVPLTWRALSRHMQWRDRIVTPDGLARQACYTAHPKYLPLCSPHSLFSSATQAHHLSCRRPQILPKSVDLGWENLGKSIPIAPGR